MSHHRKPVALTIAGSDSGGGAGIQADIKTFQALGVFGTSSVTAVTAQNTLGVKAVHPVPVEVIRAQLDWVVQDLPPDSVKSGMLWGAEAIEVVAAALSEHSLSRYVLDPVIASGRGDPLLKKSAFEAVRHKLLPLATVVTPNLEEAALLTGRDVSTPDDQAEAARSLVEMGAKAALVTGGHATGPEIVDLLWDGVRERVWSRPRIETDNTHGTGCTLSAAIAAGLAHHGELGRAVEEALAYVRRAIHGAHELGRGPGPVGHPFRD